MRTYILMCVALCLWLVRPVPSWSWQSCVVDVLQDPHQGELPLAVGFGFTRDSADIDEQATSRGQPRVNAPVYCLAEV